MLDKLIPSLIEVGPYVDELRVLGHTAQATADTPNRPRTDRHLASDRATEVVIYLQEHIPSDVLNPGRLLPIGNGQWRNIAPNDTGANRAKNRRVEMVISGKDLENSMNNEFEKYYAMNDETGSDIPSYITGGN